MARKKIFTALLISFGLHAAVLFFFGYDFNFFSVERAAGIPGSSREIAAGEVEWITVSLIPTPRSTSTGNSAPATGEGGQGEGGEGGEAGDSEILQAIRRKIARAKFYPLALKRKGIQGDPVVEFKIRESGSLEYIRLKKTSGSEELDAAALRTIQLAAPLPFHPEPVETTLRYSLD